MSIFSRDEPERGVWIQRELALDEAKYVPHEISNGQIC